MAGRRLKNFELYGKYIRLYAKSIHIKLQYREIDGYGEYLPSRSQILVDPELENSIEISTMLHELGHSLDDVLVNKRTFKAVDTAYKNVYRSRCTRKQAELVYQCEKRAWKYGRAIAKKLKIRLGKWYDETMNDCLRQYRPI